MSRGDISGGPVVKTLLSKAVCVGSICGQTAQIPCDSRPKSQNIKQKQYCNKFNKDSKNDLPKYIYIYIYIYLSTYNEVK